MTSTIVLARIAWERFEIHAATCRSRRQALVCSTCAELVERADRLADRLAELAAA
jgi:hypothetical protein